MQQSFDNFINIFDLVTRKARQHWSKSQYNMNKLDCIR